MNQTLIGPRDANGQPVPITLDDSIAQLKTTLLKDIRRSAYVYRVDCGGCNGCEIEIFAAISPLFDAERFGIKVVPSPRHADILLFTGAVTRAMRIPAIRAWQASPDPKICISYGACGNSGGIFHDLYCVWGGTDRIVPVDVYIPGCPPTPPPRFTASPWLSACSNRKSTANSMMKPKARPPRCCTRNCRSRCAWRWIAKHGAWPGIATVGKSPITSCNCWPSPTRKRRNSAWRRICNGKTTRA
ncbi:Hydrogenase-3 component G [Serratia plymuthica]|uniref:Hydrogenase-3 component G n=1 Tax=Serratia plymuthica TaxID=82996 RepID=A0A2X4XZ26_SERPL|nr:Hydrogenase-3 component G [Serratia plymuthica]